MSASLKGKVLFITGGSRGIGKAIAIRAARDGAKVAIAAKTVEPNPKLGGTIFTAAEEIEKAGGEALPIQMDIRDENNVKSAIEKTAEKFGGIDILVNNASAIYLKGTEDTPVSRYDLMNNINTRGTWLTSKLALPYLKASSNAHILNLSPPLSMESKWFKNHTAYSIAKYGMSLCVLGMSAEFQKHKIAVNALWPLTTIATEALKMIPNPNLVSRNTDIISDSAHLILTKPSSEKCNTGNFYLDELLLRKHGVVDFEKYNAVPNTPIGKLTLDFFLDPKQVEEVMKLRAQQ